MGRMYKSRHAGLCVPVRSALDQRHPVTGDIIATTPQIWAVFGEPRGEASFRNPLTGQTDIVETFVGGLFDLDAMAEQNEWSDDEKAMVERKLDRLCVKQPATIQSVDFITAPAEKPWPTYDEMDLERVADAAAALGLTGKALAYERENMKRAWLIEALEASLAQRPDPEPEPEPVLAVTPRHKEPDLIPTVITA